MSKFLVIGYETREDYSDKKSKRELYADNLKQAIEMANNLKIGVVFIENKKIYTNKEGKILRDAEYFQFHHVGVISKWFIRVTGELGVDCNGCVLDGTSEDIYLRLKSGSSLCLNDRVNPNWYGLEFEDEDTRKGVRNLIVQYCTFLEDVDIVLDKVVFSSTGEYIKYNLGTSKNNNTVIEFF